MRGGVAVFLGIALAILLHAAVLLFGGLLFPGARSDAQRVQEVELVDTSVTEEKPKEPEVEPPKDLEKPPEQAPDATEVLQNLEHASDDAPALDASSLGAIGDALNGMGGGGDFATAVGFASGGRIGGTGVASALADKMSGAFDLAEIDQKPRGVNQPDPAYPREMRGRKVEGVVTVIFVVDATGKVIDPRAEKSSHPPFERPAIDAVRSWKFEPGVRAGKRVACKMRVSVRFPPR